MKHVNFILLILFFGMFSCSKAQSNARENMDKSSIIEQFAAAGYKYDSFTTPKGRPVDIIFIKHGSIILNIDGYCVYIDPVTMFGNDFTILPKADMLFVTHEHHDHFDPEAIAQLSSDSTRLVMSQRVTELYGKGEALLPGDDISVEPANFTVTATHAYNITPEHLQFHPKERKDIGFIFDIDGLRIYVAGDTENIPEMANLRDVDIAFLPVNQPYTMTASQAVDAAEMFLPSILYPYHYGDTDLTPLVEKLRGTQIEVRVRDLQ